MNLVVGLVVLVLVLAAVAWYVLRTRGRDSGRERSVERHVEDAGAGVTPIDTAAVIDAPAVVEAPAPAPAPAVVVAVAVASPAPAAPSVAAARRNLESASPAPAELRVEERVLPIVQADPPDWSAAAAVDTPPDLLSALTSVIGPALQRDGKTAGHAILAVSFDGDDAIRIARADIAVLDALARRSASFRSSALAETVESDKSDEPADAGGWLDRDGAATLAGSVLAGWTRSRYIEALDAGLPEIKSALAAALPKLDAETQRRVKAMMHELSRFVREARDHYAAVLRKPVFIERVAESHEQAAQVWVALQDRMQAIRTQLEALARAPRYGEVQLERTVVQLRALHEERRIESLGARLVATLALLRLALGDAADEARSLDALRAAHRAGLDTEQALRARLATCERSAKGPAYAGKGEFETNRAAARSWHTRLDAEPADSAGRHLDAASAALAAGFLDGEASDWTVLLRCDGDGNVVEIRRAPASRSDSTAVPATAEVERSI
ncbi:MAG: hypothetical protein ABI156_08610 [Caldimonas sp.]